MKQIFTKILLILIFQLGAWQSFAQVNYTKRPSHRQLYVRDVASNTAIVKYEGTISNTNYTSLSLQVVKNGTTINTQTFPLNFTAGVANFNFSQAIVAEKSSYSFVLRALPGDVLLAWDQEIVAGDAYYIGGQSNVNNGSGSADPAFVTPNNQYIRWFEDSVNGWSAQPNIYLGGIPYSFADSISNALNVPVAIIKGTYGGVPIEYFLKNYTGSTYPYPERMYDVALKRIKQSKIDSFRAVIWYQGEANTTALTSTYKANFHALYNDWSQDFKFDRLYIFQIKGCQAQSATYVTISEYLRQLGQEFPKASVIATNGVDNLNQGGDNCHYSFAGYKALANRLFRQVALEIYGVGTPNGTYSPDGSNFMFTNSAKTAIKFDIVPASNIPTYEAGAHTQFFFSNSAIQATSGSIVGNTVTLNLNAPFLDANPTMGYLGNASVTEPIIRNQTGIGMLSFKFRPIADVSTPTPVLLQSFDGHILGLNNVLEWQVVKEEHFSHYELEESKDAKYFYTIGTISKNTIDANKQYNFIVNQAPQTAYYRLKMIDLDGQFAHSKVVKLSRNITPTLSVFPNPIVSKHQMLNIQFEKALQEAQMCNIIIYDVLGRKVNIQNIKAEKGDLGLQMQISNLPSGNYFGTIKVNKQTEMMGNFKFTIQ